MNLQVTPAFAKIHAHICGDGYLYHYREKDHYGPYGKYRKNPYRTRYRVVYTNTRSELLKDFRRDLTSVFGVKGLSYEGKYPKLDVRVNSKRIYDTLRELGAGGSFVWRIPKLIEKGSLEVQKAWLQAFFDDEADFDENEKGEVFRIRVKCVNKPGLLQVKNMLEKFVPCNLLPKEGFYWGKTVCINIKKADVSKFFSEIGSIRYTPGQHRRSSTLKTMPA